MMKSTLIFTCIFFGLFISAYASNPAKSTFQNMNPDYILKSYATYNRWANEQIIDWMKEATEEQLDQEVESSFNSLQATINHIYNAEFGWLTTLNNESWESAPKHDNFNDFFKAFIDNSKAFENKVLALLNEGFEEQRFLGKDKKATSLADIILHVFNHSTFHRGQLITIGRQAGLKNPPRTDYIYFINLDDK